MSEAKSPKILDVRELLPPKGECIIRIPVKREYNKMLSFLFKLFPQLKSAEKVKDIDVSFIPSKVIVLVITKVSEFSKLESKSASIDEGLEDTEAVLKDLAEIIKFIFEINFPEVTSQWILDNLTPGQMVGVMNYAITSFKETMGKNAVAAQEVKKMASL